MRDNQVVHEMKAESNTSSEVMQQFSMIPLCPGCGMAASCVTQGCQSEPSIGHLSGEEAPLLNASLPEIAKNIRLMPTTPEKRDIARQTVKIMIAESEALTREGLKAILSKNQDFEIVGTVSSEALSEAVRALYPDILIVGSIVTKEGLDNTAELAREFPDTKVIFLSRGMSDDQLRVALKAGIRGIVSNNDGSDSLMSCIQAVRHGSYCVYQGIGDQVLQMLWNRAASTVPSMSLRQQYGLSEREFEVVQLLLDGLHNAEIAEAFSLSLQTVKHHVSSIFKKMKVGNRVELALLASRSMHLGMTAVAVGFSTALECGQALLPVC